MNESKSAWDIKRFWQTLDYFDTIPLWSCLQKLINQRENKRVNLQGDRGIKTVLVIGATGTIGKSVIRQLLGKNYSIRALVNDIESARQILGENVDLFATRSPQLLEGVDRVIYCADNGQNLADLVNWLKNTPITTEKMLFDFRNPTADIQAIWGAVDDVVMGGVSESNIRLARGKALFSGTVLTTNNGGFASVRTRNFDPALSLSDYEGIELRVEGDGKRYKFIARCEGRWDGVSYCYSFDTIPNLAQTIRVPFRELIPVIRAKRLSNGEFFDTSRVYALQLMHSKFEYDGALNPRFSPGRFGLEIEWIKAYGRGSGLIIVQEGESIDERILQDNPYPYTILTLSQFVTLADL